MSLEGLTEGQVQQLAKGMQALLNSQDAEVRKGTQRMLKKIDPKLSFPELEVEDHIETALKPLREDNEKLRNELKEKDFRESVEHQHANILSRGYKVEDVQKLMAERGIVKFETALEVLDMQNRLAPPTPDALAHAGNYSMPENVTDIMKNPAAWARKTAHTIIDGFLAKKRA